MSLRPIENGVDGSSSLKPMKGYSLVEVIIVLAIVMIMTAIALPYLFNSRRMYRSEDQAIQVMDLMREAGQLAITRRTVVRVELDNNPADRARLRMINENGAGPAVLIKTIPLEPLNHVRMDVAPAGVLPPNPPNYPAAAYVGNVWSARFKSDGSVVNGADIPISATLYSWRPIMEPGTPFNMGNLTPARREEVRAVTIFGGSGAVRYWKFAGAAWVSSQ